MTDEIGILRRCVRCDEWRSIEMFEALGKMCQRCIRGKVRTNRISYSRCMQITPKGRAALQEMKELQVA